MTTLDLTEIPGDIVAAILKALPAPDGSRTEWTYSGDHAYTARTVHRMPDGHIVTAWTVAPLTELEGDDWRLVVGLTADEWNDFRAQWKESA